MPMGMGRASVPAWEKKLTRLPPILKQIDECPTTDMNTWCGQEHRQQCLESCYSCLKNDENQPVHGLLDWRLGLCYLRAFVQPQWLCGLDGDYSWGPLQDWPELAQRSARQLLRLWGGEADELLRSSSRPDLIAFRLPGNSPLNRTMVIVRHPLWRWVMSTGVLDAFRVELSERHPNQPMLCWDTFNLTRRPGRTRQWMLQQGARRRQRRGR